MQWTGLFVVVIALAVATAYGLLRQSRQGRIRPVLAAASQPGGAGRPAMSTAAVAPAPPAAAVEPAAPSPDAAGAGGATDDAALLAAVGVAEGEVTLLQFSSAFCAPCRATRAVLADVAGRTDGVTHLEVDAESHLDIVRALKIWRTPTTFIIDTEGRIVGRAQGIPNRSQVLAAVTPLLARHTSAPQGQPS
jgi:thiol-disulfide isomerase/thioredoxin